MNVHPLMLDRPSFQSLYSVRVKKETLFLLALLVAFTIGVLVEQEGEKTQTQQRVERVEDE